MKVANRSACDPSRHRPGDCAHRGPGGLDPQGGHLTKGVVARAGLLASALETWQWRKPKFFLEIDTPHK